MCVHIISALLFYANCQSPASLKKLVPFSFHAKLPAIPWGGRESTRHFWGAADTPGALVLLPHAAACPMLWSTEAGEMPPASRAGANDSSGSLRWSKDLSRSSAAKYNDLSYNTRDLRCINSPMSTTLSNHRCSCCQQEKNIFLQNLRWPFWTCDTRLLGKNPKH